MQITEKNSIAREHCRQEKAKGDSSSNMKDSLYNVEAVFEAIATLAKDKKNTHLKMGRKVLDLAGVDPKKLKSDIEDFGNGQVEKELITDIPAEILKSLRNQKQLTGRHLLVEDKSHTRTHLADKVAAFDPTSMNPTEIKEVKKTLVSLYKKKNIMRIKGLSDESFVNLAGFLAKANLRKVAKDLDQIVTGEFLDKYRGWKCGKYATDAQMTEFDKLNATSEFRTYVDSSEPQGGFTLSKDQLEHQRVQHEKTGKWYYFFDDNGRPKNKDLVYEAFSFYRPSEPADIEHLIQLEIPYPENWFYPAASIVPESTFSKILEVIESRWIALPG